MSFKSWSLTYRLLTPSVYGGKPRPKDANFALYP